MGQNQPASKVRPAARIEKAPRYPCGTGALILTDEQPEKRMMTSAEQSVSARALPHLTADDSARAVSQR